MLLKHNQDTNFTLRVKSLSHQIFGKTQAKNSMLDNAVIYFASQNNVQLNDDLDEESPNSKINKVIKSTKVLEKNSSAYKKETIKNELEREERFEHLDALCREVILLSEGESFEESNRKSSQLLATIQLLTPSESTKVALSNELNKPLYKAVLCLRVLDRLCIDNRITDTYIKERLVDITPQRFTSFSVINPEAYKKFIDEVKIPLVKAALLQDIGNNHPDAQLILKGEDESKNPFRMLEADDRKKLLQIDYRETVKYLIEGIGVGKYRGQSREERDAFNQAEKRKLLFIKTLLKNSINPKKGIGNLLKVPQIYISMVLSTKPDFNYVLLPNVYKVLYQNAERGVCHKTVVDAMYVITGTFPLGYGITYIAENTHGDKQYSYEYAIVKMLYPKDPELPICRTATRNLTFISFGQDIVIPKERNLHYPEVAKKLHSLSKDRLNEILALLSSNYTERKKLDLIPRCWLANEYFSVKAHQKLWNK